ncbi:hypothetical protein FDECE_14093 [Fusarium decemcellulare]|nr:hypothetical protein FDECE_14093 [Fusarium decemcellulare]
MLPRSMNLAILLPFCLSGFLTSMDSVMVGTVLPTIVEALALSSVQFSWVGTSYLIPSATLLPLWAQLSDIFGRKYIILLGYLLFIIGSLICAISHNSTMLIAGRAVQGAGTGNIEVLINICIADLFTLRDRGLYIGMYSAASAAGVVLGPILGGILAGSTTWRWCFWINLPIGCISVFWLWKSLNLPNTGTPICKGLRHVDWPGAISITAGAVMLLLGVQLGGTLYAWSSPAVLSLVLCGFAVLVLFLFLQQKISVRPTIPLRLFGNISGSVALFICFCHGFSYITILYFLPVYFSVVLSASPTTVGAYLSILTGPMVLSVAGAGVFVERTGHYRITVWAGTLFLTLGFGLFIDLPPYLSWARIVIYQLVIALGVGPLFQMPLIVLHAWTERKDLASANSLYSLTREMGSSIGIVVAQILIQVRVKQNAAKALRGGLPRDLVSKISRDFTILSKSLLRELPDQQQHELKRILTMSVGNVWMLEAGISGVALLSSYLIKYKELSKEYT